MMFKRLFIALLIGGLSLSGSLHADTVKGRIKYISKKASTIQIAIPGKDPVVVRFDDRTKYENNTGIKDLNPPDLITVEFDPGQPARSIAKMTFGLPQGVEIDIKGLKTILQGKQGPYVLLDARPAKFFPAAHLPSAVSAFPGDKAKFLATLPKDKGQLLVFYCGGPTCPFTSKAVDLALANGYTSLKGFQAGIPGWKQAKLPVYTSSEWLAERLNENHVVIDVRDPAQSEARHIESAASLPANRIKQMTKEFIQSKQRPLLPGVVDKFAPIIVYGNQPNDRAVLSAFKNLRRWGYKNVSILETGMDDWSRAGLPTDSGPAEQTIRYVKKLPKGSIPPKEFAQLAHSAADVVFIDVRRDDEVAKHVKLKNALHIPLDRIESSLDRIPKDKPVIAYCANGIRAEMAYETLRAHGYQVRFLNQPVAFSEQGSILCAKGNLAPAGSLPPGC